MADNPMEQQVRDLLMKRPGKRGIDVPAEAYDRIVAHASAQTLPVWGRHPMPEHIQHFYDNGGHEDSSVIDAFYHSQPHPHAPETTVGQYHQWKQAYTTWKSHTRG